MTVTLDSNVEELVEAYPKASSFLADRGVVCIRCGEAYWGTLGELMASKHIPDPEALVADLNAFVDAHETTPGE